MKNIYLTNGRVTLVSDKDHIYLAGYSWHFDKGYVRGWLENKHQYIHEIIIRRMKLNLEGKEVDHINRNQLDNRRENLRVATRSQNQANSIKQRDNTSGYKGVSWHKRNRKWMTKIQVSGKQIHLGYFDIPEEAHTVYVEAAKKYFGDFAHG